MTITDNRGASSSSPVTIRKPAGSELYGGSVGLYSLAGAISVSDIEVGTSIGDAGPAVETPPLQCLPSSPNDYDLPNSDQVVVDTIPVGRSWSGHPVGQAIRTHGDKQYVAYYDENRDLVVAARDLNTTVWTKKVLNTRIGWDSHNYVTLAIDSTGNIHISGNMHGSPMNYWRTTEPGDITTLTQHTTLVDGSQERVVTYPTFFEGPGGQLLFRFRAGWSGSGNDIYYSYDTGTQTWSALLDTPMMDGEGERNAYVGGPMIGPDGYYHLLWTWRENADAGTNHDLYYARSANMVDWETSDGQPLQLPLKDGQGDLVAEVPMYGGLLNGWMRFAFGPDSSPYISYLRYDESDNHQFYVARVGEHGWESTQVTQWTGRIELLGGGSLNGDAFSPGAFERLVDGNLGLGYSCHGVNETLVLDPDTLSVLGQSETPPKFPAGFMTPESDYPGIQVRVGVSTLADGSRYVLRWEAMPQNQDQPYEEYEEPQPIRVYHLKEVDDSTAYEGAQALLRAYYDEGQLERSNFHELRTHLATAKRLAEAGEPDPAERSLDRFVSIAEEVSDEVVRTGLVTIAEALRAQL